MVHLSIHGALWCSIDRNSAIFVFEASNFQWKLETEKNGRVNYTAESIILPRI